MSVPLTSRDANQGMADVKENPFGIAPNALKYKPTAILVGDSIGESILNRWLRYSYLSLYSRLANTQPLVKP